MVAATRSATKAQHKTGGPGVSKKVDEKKKQDALVRNLEKGDEAYEKGDEQRKNDIASQLSFIQPKQKHVEMQVDAKEDDIPKHEPESPLFLPDGMSEQLRQEPKQTGADQTHTPPQEDYDPELPDKSTGQPEATRHKSQTNEVDQYHTPPQEEDDPEDIIRASPPRHEGDDDGGLTEGFMRGCFGRQYNISRIGPLNAGKFRCRSTGYHNEEEECLDDTSHGTKKHKGKNISKRGDIYAIQGVAWLPIPGCDLYSSLKPEEWQARKGRRPEMRIKVKWRHLAENGKPLVTWEKRQAILRCWEDEDGGGHSIVKVDEDWKVGNTVILNEGISMTRADYVIVTAAIRCEDRYDEWHGDKRPGKERSPTAGLPRLGEKTRQQEQSDGELDKPNMGKPQPDPGERLIIQHLVQ